MTAIKEFLKLWAEADKEVRRLFIYRYIGVGLVVGSFILLGLTVSWWAAVGVFLMITGNNIERTFKRF